MFAPFSHYWVIKNFARKKKLPVNFHFLFFLLRKFAQCFEKINIEYKLKIKRKLEKNINAPKKREEEVWKNRVN